MEALWHLMAIALGIGGSAFFSGMETGLISLNRLRLRHDVEERDRRALILNSFVENTERLLGTTLVGNNLANVLLAVTVAELALRWFGPGYFVQLTATMVGSALLVIFGEIVPKTLFRDYSHRLCMTFADVLNAIAWLFAPLVAMLGGLMRAISRMGGRPEPRKFFVTREELKHLAREGEAGGELTTDESRMIHRVFDFPYKTVFDVMVPVSQVASVGRDATIQQLLALSQRTGFARFPVSDGTRLVGVVNAYEILFADAAQDVAAPIGPFIRPLPLVLSTERVDRVLPRLRTSRVPISVAVESDGRQVGVVTVEDLIEEIVGELEG